MSTKPFGHRTRDEVLKLWVAALRSGEYKQGQGHLRRGEEFCCLGVLCDLDDREKWTGACINEAYVYDNISEYSLPYKIYEFIKVNTVLLMHMNDDGMSFKEIADHIERDYILQHNEFIESGN